MSVVACKVTENGYEIAADSITVRYTTQTRGQTKHAKLFEINGMVVGGVGSAQETALLRIFAKTRQPADANEAAIVEFVSEFAEWKNKRMKDSDINNRYILGFDGKAFLVEGWFIDEILTYAAIGAGMDFALAALYLGNSAEKAVETAIELSIYCEPPIQVIKRERND